MDDFSSSTAEILEELHRLLREYEEKIRTGMSDPENFMTISELETLWGNLNAESEALLRKLTQELINSSDMKRIEGSENSGQDE